jgi:hypothetical protein
MFNVIVSTSIFNLIGDDMKTQEAIDYWGGVKNLADDLKTWPQTIYQWGEYPPMGRQYEIEIKSDGQLRAEKEVVK